MYNATDSYQAPRVDRVCSTMLPGPPVTFAEDEEGEYGAHSYPTEPRLWPAGDRGCGGGISLDGLPGNEIITGLRPAEDTVNHPAHYNSHPSGVECITITEHMTFCAGNAIKYLWRAGLKGNEAEDVREKHLEDLRKAKWYIEREISRIGGYDV